MKTMPNELASFALSKRTAGLDCIALCLVAWGYNAEAAMGLALAASADIGINAGCSMGKASTSAPTDRL